MFSFSSVPLFILLSAAATTYTSGEAPDIRLPGNAEVLRYIEESRLMGIAELERLDELESLVLKRMDLQDEEESEREKEAMHRFRRLQEDATAVEEKAEVGGMTIGKNRIRNQQEGYYSDGIFNRGNNRYRGDNYGRNYGNNNWYYPESEWNDNRDGWNRRRVCCQQCNRGDIECLSDCDRICKKSQTCNKAGEGAYAAFCSRECPNSIHGFSAGERYLPTKACEGECAAQVQELCVAHSCRDYGCVVRNCQEEAPLMCLMTHFR